MDALEAYDDRQERADVCQYCGEEHPAEQACPQAAINRAAHLEALLSRPYVGAWLDEVLVEAAHQRERWGLEHDAGKEPEDFFWLVGYLAGKCLRAHRDGDRTKARHHTVSTAAALAHWAASISGEESVFRPGIGSEALAESVNAERPR